MSQEVERNVHPKLDQRRGAGQDGVILLARSRPAITCFASPERSTLRWEVDLSVGAGSWLEGLGSIAGGKVCLRACVCVCSGRRN